MASKVKTKDKTELVRGRMRMAPFHTADAIVAAVPKQLWDNLTVAELALVADALHYAHQFGIAQAERDILREGAIYSPDAGKMLEVKKVENYVVVAV